MPRPTLVHPDDRPEESWDDPAKGPIRWKTLLSGGLTDTDSVTVGIAMLRKGEHWVPHRHAEAELYFGISGAFEVEIEGQRHQLRPEAALYIPGHALHAIPPVGEDVRFLYAFAADSFSSIAYEFPEESP